MLKAIQKKFSSRLGHDVVWTFTIQILIMFCSFAINKLLANRLSIDDYGQYNVIKRSVQVISFIMLAGVGITLPRYIPIYRNSTPPRKIAPFLFASMIYIIGVSLAVVVVCTLFSAQMQTIIIGQEGNISLFLVALAYAFTLAIAQFAFAYYRGIGDFKSYNGSQLAMQFLIVLPLVMLPMLTISKVFISWLIITSLLVACIFIKELWIIIQKRGSIKSETPIKSHLLTIIKYSSGRLVADFFQYSLATFPLIYISKVNGLQDTAYFSVGITFVSMVVPLFIFMGIILLPYVSENIAQNNIMKANHLISRLQIIYIVSSLFVIIILLFFTAPLTKLFFANEYMPSLNQTRIMTLAILPQALYMLYRTPIDAVSVIPYNAIILGICIVVMFVCFKFSSTLDHYACAYLVVSTLQGFLSCFTWHLLKKI